MNPADLNPRPAVSFAPPAALLSLNDRHHCHRQRQIARAWRAAAMAAAVQYRHGVTEVQAWFLTGQVQQARQPLEVAARLIPLTIQPHLPPAIVTITLPVRDRRARDPHNYFATVKPIVDGLVDAGLWPDDTPDWVTTTEPRLVPHAPLVIVDLVVRPA